MNTIQSKPRSEAVDRFTLRARQAPGRKPVTCLAGVALALTLGITGCATPEAQRGADTFGRGVMNLVLSPFMIASGLAQGLAFLPYTIGTGLDELNKGLLEAQAVSLDDSYKAIHDVSITDPRVNPKTGQVTGRHFNFGQHRPEAMMEATLAFRRLLVSQGMDPVKSEQYALVGDYRRVRSDGHILLAVVHRQRGMQAFRVRSKETGIVTTLRPEHQGWLAAYDRDVGGHTLDEIIDWTAVDYSSLQRDKVVAMLMILAAESVKSGKRSPDYWQAEHQWLAGDTNAVVAASRSKVERALPATIERT